MKTRLLITALAMLMAMGIKATAENRDDCFYRSYESLAHPL